MSVWISTWNLEYTVCMYHTQRRKGLLAKQQGCCGQVLPEAVDTRNTVWTCLLVPVCCGKMQWGAVSCSELQPEVATDQNKSCYTYVQVISRVFTLYSTDVITEQHNTLPNTATHCNTANTRQHTATHGNTRQDTATHSNTQQHAATCCNTLQHAATQELHG